MNIFNYTGKEFDKKLDEIFKNKDKEELKQELIECGLEINNSNRLKYLMKKIDKIVKNMSIEEIEERIKVAEMEEDIEHIKWERDYYKLRFEELNKNWNKVIHALLGEDYYNYGCDWKTCDDFTAEDLIYKYKKRWWQFWKKI